MKGHNGSPIGFDRRHNGSPHWLLYPQCCWDRLLSNQVSLNTFLRSLTFASHFLFQAVLVNHFFLRFFISLRISRAVQVAVNKTIFWKTKNNSEWMDIGQNKFCLCFFSVFSMASAPLKMTQTSQDLRKLLFTCRSLIPYNLQHAPVGKLEVIWPGVSALPRRSLWMANCD